MQAYDDINNEIGEKDGLPNHKIIYKKLSILNKQLTRFNWTGVSVDVSSLDINPHQKYVKNNRKLNGIYFYEQSYYDNFVNLYIKGLNLSIKRLNEMNNSFGSISDPSNIARLYDTSVGAIQYYKSKIDNMQGSGRANEIKKKKLERGITSAHELKRCIFELNESIRNTLKYLKLINALHDENVNDHLKLARWCKGYKAASMASKRYSSSHH